MRETPIPWKSSVEGELGVQRTRTPAGRGTHVRGAQDNPFSDSQFKTLKYRPDIPDRFGALEHGRSFCGDFFPGYITEHHHVGLGLFTPEDFCMAVAQ
jgi:hypothetical protein